MTVLVEAVDLKKHFPLAQGMFSREKRVVHAVDGVSFTIEQGETLGLVGESGCGKTTLGRLLLGLEEPTSGCIRFMGKDVAKLEAGELRTVRRQMQIIFQNPFSSLNPRKTVRQIQRRPFLLYRDFEGGKMSSEEIDRRVIQLLEMVRMTPAETYLNRYPHELSGGQRQRICIARAISLDPKFIVADEPVSSLDMSIRAQIVNLMLDIQRRTMLTFMLIAHDLSVLPAIAVRVAVMYLGRIVELAETEVLFKHPIHPYTEALMSACPIPDPRLARARRRIILSGDVASPIEPPAGCRFHTRCSFVQNECRRFDPQLINIGSGHFVACPIRTEKEVN